METLSTNFNAKSLKILKKTQDPAGIRTQDLLKHTMYTSLIRTPYKSGYQSGHLTNEDTSPLGQVPKVSGLEQFGHSTQPAVPVVAY